eukprot:Skav208019  [mRNA]  locus=scaffold2714:48935:51329:- [translate_table: standard]
MSAAPNPRKRLQQVFEAHDANGDGHRGPPGDGNGADRLVNGIKGSKHIFKQADKNKDGTVQVHEFISWLTSKDPKCSILEEVADGQGRAKTVRVRSISATVTNTNLKATQKFYIEFTSCNNVDFVDGQTVCVVLGPGEQKTVKLLGHDMLRGRDAGLHT